MLGLLKKKKRRIRLSIPPLAAGFPPPRDPESRHPGPGSSKGSRSRAPGTALTGTTALRWLKAGPGGERSGAGHPARPGPAGLAGTWETGGGTLYSAPAGPVSAPGSGALGTPLARFFGRAAGTSRFLLAAAMSAAPRRPHTSSASARPPALPALLPLPAPPGSAAAAMPFSARPPGSGEPYVLSASLDNARHLSSLLRAVHFQDHATCFATANGLKVTVEDAKCIQANAFIQVGAAARARARARARLPLAGLTLPGAGGEEGPAPPLDGAPATWRRRGRAILPGEKGELGRNRGVAAGAGAGEALWRGCGRDEMPVLPRGRAPCPVCSSVPAWGMSLHPG